MRRTFDLRMPRSLRSPQFASLDAERDVEHVVVLLREHSRRVVEGLRRACEEAWSRAALVGLRVRVVCLQLEQNSRTMLSSAARTLGGAIGLVAGHGSGLATLPFMPMGARFAEADNIANAQKARNMYQHLARALGLVATKVWLNGSGVRFCPRRTIGCTAAGGGNTIHGCSVGYTGNVTMPAGVLREVLRDCALGTPSMARDCGIDRDEERPKHRPFDLDDEMRRLF